MSARVSRVIPPKSTARNSQRSKMVLNVDLNVPPSDNFCEVGTSSHAPPVDQQVQAGQPLSAPQVVVPIDVDSFDDDVVLCSPRAFAEAKNNSRRNQTRSNVVDIDQESSSRVAANNRNKRQRGSTNPPVINCESYVIPERRGNGVADGRHQLSNASRGSNSSMATSETLSSSIHQKRGRLQQRPPAERGNQTPDKGTAIPAWGVWNTDPQQVEGFTGAFTRAKEERSFVNWGRIPLLDEDSIVARGLTLGRADNDDTYGGGKRLKVKPTDSNHQNVGQFGNASKSVPASTVGSETPFHDKTKLIQLWHHFIKKCTTFYKKAASRVR